MLLLPLGMDFGSPKARSAFAPINDGATQSRLGRVLLGLYPEKGFNLMRVPSGHCYQLQISLLSAIFHRNSG